MILELQNNTYKLKNGYIKFEPINASMLGIKTNKSIEFYQDSIIIGELVLTKKDQIKVQLSTGITTLYTFNHFTKDTGDLFSDLILIEVMPNKTTMYLLPVLGKNMNFYSVNIRLINSYLSEDYKYLYLKYRFSNTDGFKNLDKALQNHPLFRESSNPTKSHILFKFRIPIEYEKDIYLIMKGKFSRVSSKLKKRILQFYDTDETSHVGGVLYKTKERRKFLENVVGYKIPEDIDLDDKPHTQLELWKD